MLNQNKLKIKMLSEEYFNFVHSLVWKYQNSLAEKYHKYDLQKLRNKVGKTPAESAFNTVINTYFEKTSIDHLFYIMKEKNSKEPRSFFVFLGADELVNKIGLPFGKYFIIGKYICRKGRIEDIGEFNYTNHSFVKFFYYLTMDEIENKYEFIKRIDNELK